MDNLIFGLYTNILSISWTGLQVFLIVLYALIIKKYKISGHQTALFGFIFLGITGIFNLIHQDAIAGKLAEYVWIILTVAFIQQFTHFLKYENK